MLHTWSQVDDICLILHIDDKDVHVGVHIVSIYVARSYDDYYSLSTTWLRSLYLVLIINVIFVS